eukprot:GEMP01004806.1.p1 GENE.GEMP01004806.1~~GEMP01004806.1.p1  ORF type:complete len:953 (+),score=198.39 GEMP01004806.1:50-2908(+)
MQHYPLCITIPRTEERSGPLTNHTVYVVEVDDCGRIFHRFRRYASFSTFYNRLKVKIDFPRKKYVGNCVPTFVEERRSALEQFLLELVSNPEMILGDLLWSFLETPAETSVVPRYLCGGVLAPLRELALNDAMVFRLCNRAVVKLLMSHMHDSANLASIAVILRSMLSRPGARTILLEEGAVAALCSAMEEIENEREARLAASTSELEDCVDCQALQKGAVDSLNFLAAQDVVITLIESDPAGAVLSYFQDDGLLSLRRWAESGREHLHDAASAMMWLAIKDDGVRQALASDIGLSLLGLLLVSPSLVTKCFASLSLSVFACLHLLPEQKEQRVSEALKNLPRTIAPPDEVTRTLLGNDEFNQLLLQSANAEIQDFFLWILACFCENMLNCTKLRPYRPLLHAIDSPAAAQVLLFVPWPSDAEISLEVLLQQHTAIQTVAGAANEQQRICISKHECDQARLAGLLHEAVRRDVSITNPQPPQPLCSHVAEEGDLLHSSQALHKLDASLSHLRDKRFQLGVALCEAQSTLQSMTTHLERTAIALAQLETQKSLEQELAEIQVNEGYLDELRAKLRTFEADEAEKKKLLDDTVCELTIADKKRVKTAAQMRRMESEAIMAERRLKHEKMHLDSLPSRIEQAEKMRLCKEEEVEKLMEDERKYEDLACPDIAIYEKEVIETSNVLQILKNVDKDFATFRCTLESETVLTAPQQAELERLCETLPEQVEWDRTKTPEYRLVRAVLDKTMQYWEKINAQHQEALDEKLKCEKRRQFQLSTVRHSKGSVLDTLESLRQELKQLIDDGSCRRRFEETKANYERAVAAREETSRNGSDAALHYSQVEKLIAERKAEFVIAHEETQTDSQIVAAAATELSKKCSKVARCFQQLDELGRKVLECRKQWKVRQNEVQGLLSLSEEALVAEEKSRRQLQQDLAELRIHLSRLDSQLEIPEEPPT